MKKLFFLFMMLAMGMYAQAQQLDVCTKPYGDDGSEITVIKPTVANFLQLLSMTEEQFKAAMEANKYSTQMPRSNFISYCHVDCYPFSHLHWHQGTFSKSFKKA
jgi:hypothetical protein